MTEPQARPATPADIPEVLRLAAAMFASMGLEPSGPWEDHAAEVLRRRLASGTAAAFVIDDPETQDHAVCAPSVARTCTALRDISCP